MIPCMYDWAFDFSEGLAQVAVNDRVGYVDKQGKLVVPCIYDMIMGEGVPDCSFSGGLAYVSKNGKTGYINKAGAEVLPLIYDEVSSVSEGFVAVERYRKWGFVGIQSDKIAPQYDSVGNFSEGLAWVEQNGKYGFINTKGEMVVPCIYDYAESFSDGMAVVKKNNKYGYVNKYCWLVLPCVYDYAYSFSSGVAEVKLNGNRINIDKDGNTLAYNINDFREEGLACVYQGDKYGFINREGEQVIPCIYESVETVFDIDSCEALAYYDSLTLVFKDGLRIVVQDGIIKIINKKGQVIIPNCTLETKWSRVE